MVCTILFSEVGKGNIDEAGNIDKAIFSAWFHPFWVLLRNRVHFEEPVLFGKVCVNLSFGWRNCSGTLAGVPDLRRHEPSFPELGGREIYEWFTVNNRVEIGKALGSFVDPKREIDD
jgi:hypothetical protein